MSKVVCLDACSVLRCSFDIDDDTLKVLVTDANKYALLPDTHVYLIIEADDIREEVRFDGGSTINGVLTVVRGTDRQSFPAGATVCTAITCSFLEDFICQKVLECTDTPDPGTGIDIPGNNTWTGLNVFQRAVQIGDAVISPDDLDTLGMLVANRGLAVERDVSLVGSQYGFLGVTNRISSSGPVVGAQFSGFSSVGFTDVVGLRGEAGSVNSVPNILTGVEGVVLSQESNSSEKKVGIRSVFKNRPVDFASVPGGLGTNKYNQNAWAYAVESQSRSSAGEFCGWSRGIVFAAGSLDEAASTKATGIDFSELSAVDLTRIDSLIRLKHGASIEWNGDSAAYSSVKTQFDRVTSQWKLLSGGNPVFAVDTATGRLRFGTATSNVALLQASAGAVSGQYLPIEINGQTYKIELRAN